MASNLPSWIQEVSIFAVATVSIIVGVWRYIKTETAKAPDKASQVNTGHVVAASFVDSKLLKELIDALREHQEELARIALRTTRSQSELRECVLENTEASRLQADATLNMIRFLSRRQTIKGEYESQ
jgi:acyl-CoA reductase-like NAD-dependent aldehyde dehydrogenase